MEFHGRTITSEGLRPSSDKICAEEECEPPRNREELISFLQMLAYLSRYISKFLSRCEPLCRLTRENAQFISTNEQQRAFEDLKRAITAAPVLIPFNPACETLVICNGSPTGLGGSLFQKTQRGQRSPLRESYTHRYREKISFTNRTRGPGN